jgi:hypothetical protein
VLAWECGAVAPRERPRFKIEGKGQIIHERNAREPELNGLLVDNTDWEIEL